jgi:UDP-N-acetylglucosamine transferase subunit ALG13
VMEALDLGKALLVVVNTGLMDDHQQELARAMEKQVRKTGEGYVRGK